MQIDTISLCLAVLAVIFIWLSFFISTNTVDLNGFEVLNIFTIYMYF